MLGHILQESQQHDDLLRLDMEESYYQLPRKTLAGLTFILNRLAVMQFSLAVAYLLWTQAVTC